MTERRIKSGFPVVILLFFQTTFCLAQNPQPVKWNFKSEPVTRPETTLIITASIAPGWHIYSQFMEKGGPLPTGFSFERSEEYSLVGKPEEKGKAIKFYDDIFMIDIIWYSDVVTFSQKIKLYEPFATVKGKVEFMVCNNQMCLPVNEQIFNIEVKPLKNP